MKKYVLKNGVKLIYEQRQGNLSSFCIGFEAGANMEDGFPLGTAHAVEHMLFKGTIHRNENLINRLIDEVFAFSNAMTNYPYSIYYGTTLSTDFERGFELYTDILLNPSFPYEGFNEEISIIGEELKEWKDDPNQYCEDMLLKNAFNTRRIKERIIGTEESLSTITIDILLKFYNKFYCPNNCVVSVASSVEFEEVRRIVEDCFGSWEKEYQKEEQLLYEHNNEGIYTEVKPGINGAKLQYIFPIHELSEKEISALRLFNIIFGEGTSSLLYDEIRTKQGLVYDIKSIIKNERGIKLLSISLATSKKNIEKAIHIIDKIIIAAKTNKELYSSKELNKYVNILRLKREFMSERAVEYCKNLTTYEIMYNNYEKLQNEVNLISSITAVDIIAVINKVLSNPSIQIIEPM